MSLLRKTIPYLLCVALVVLIPCFAWASGGEGIRIGLVDTGVSTANLDPEKILPGKNFVFPKNDTEDRVGHGTRIAGLILGSKALGVEGSAPNAEIVPLVWFDKYPSGVEQNGGPTCMAKAIRAAVDEFDCDIINLSSGLREENEELKAAVEYAERKGVLVVAAVGNDNVSHSEWVYYPAAWETPLGVGSFDNGAVSLFSQRHGVDLLAPGGDFFTVTNKTGTKATKVTGTSYACGYASGVCAQWLERDPEMTPAQLRQKLFDTAQDISPMGKDEDSGWGLIMPPGRSFEDVPRDSWYADAVTWAFDEGVMTGVSKDRFGPEGITDRAMTVTALWRMEGCPQSGSKSAGTAAFTDLTADWYRDAVSWAVSEGIVKGTGNNRFRPDSPVTREQFASILYRFAQYKGSDVDKAADLSHFTDAGEVSVWAEQAICWAVGNDILRGNGTELMPQESTDRAQTATLLMRLSQNMGY